MPKDLITADALEKLTGLSDRRHRQLAKAGYFPIPKMSMYQMAATIRGMFNYYREEFQRGSKVLMDDKQIKLKREVELLDLRIAQQRGELVALVDVEIVWNKACLALRQVILAADIPTQAKEELARHLREIPVDEYIAQPAVDAVEEIAATDSVAA